MNDSELMQKFLEDGYVIDDPGTFYREIRAYGLQRLINDLAENERKLQSVSYDYSEVEEDVLNYIREVRNIVVNDERYGLLTSSELTSLNSLLRVLDGKYLISGRNDERRFDINTEIGNARSELSNLNSEVSRVEGEIRTINSRRGAARREISTLESNTSLTNVERTQRTFELMNELTALESELGNKNNELSDLRNQINNKNNEISNLEESLDAIVDEAPTFNSEMRDTLVEDVERVNSFVNRLNISGESKQRIKNLSDNFGARQSVPLVDYDRATYDTDMLYRRFGIRRTNEYVKKDVVEVPVIEEVKEEPKKDELVDNFSFDFFPLKEDVKEEIKEEPAKEEVVLTDAFIKNAESQLKLFSEDGKKSFLGTHIREARKSNPEYLDRWIKYAESLGYNIDELEHTDENIFISELDAQTKMDTKEDTVVEAKEETKLPSEKDSIKGIFYARKKHDRDMADIDELENGTEVEIEEVLPNGFLKLVGYDCAYTPESVIEKEVWDDMAKEETKLPSDKDSNKRIFYINDTDPFEAFIAISENLANGDEVEIEEILPDGYVKLVGHHGPINPKMIITVEKWEELLKENPDLKPANREGFLRDLASMDDEEETKSSSAIYSVGDEVIFYEAPGLSDDEKEYFDVNYKKRGIEPGKKYKISKVNDNSSVQLEGVRGNFPTMGFLPASLYEESILSTSDIPKKVEKPEVEETKEKKDDDDLVVYVGKDTDLLKNGKVYNRRFAFGRTAVFVDEKGNEFKIDDYEEANFKEYVKEEVKDLPKPAALETKDRSDKVKGLPKVTAVEEITKISKIGGGLTAIGICGLVGGVLLNPLLGASTVAVLASSGVVAGIGTILQSKFALNARATRLINRFKKTLEEYCAKETNAEGLSAEEEEVIRNSKSEIEKVLSDFEKASSELGISHKII